MAEGKNYVEMVYADPARTAHYARVMSVLSAEAVRAIVTRFPWQDHRSVIDIGCATAGSRASIPVVTVASPASRSAHYRWVIRRASPPTVVERLGPLALR